MSNLEILAFGLALCLVVIAGIIVYWIINRNKKKEEPAPAPVKTYSLRNSPVVKLTCPRCGETGEMRQRHYTDYLTWYYIVCLNCGHKTQDKTSLKDCYMDISDDVKYIWKVTGKDITHCPYCGEKLEDNKCTHCGFEV